MVGLNPEDGLSADGLDIEVVGEPSEDYQYSS